MPVSDDLFLDGATALRDARNAVFAPTLDRIFVHHPHYLRAFAEHGISRGDVTGVDDLPRLPVTGKADFVTAPDDFVLRLPTSFDAEERVVWDVMYTTGSTGDPTPFTSTSYDFLNILALNRNMLRLRGVT